MIQPMQETIEVSLLHDQLSCSVIDVLTVGSLAYAEMRLILARFLWNFDLELTESG